jgi:hypothetical protein
MHVAFAETSLEHVEGPYHVAYQARFETKASEEGRADLGRCGDVFGASERCFRTTQWAGNRYTAAGHCDASRSHSD